MLNLDKVKNIGQAMASRVSDKANEINAKVVQREAAEEQYIVGLDIGTEFVKALIGRVQHGGIEIIGVGRQHQGLGDMQAGAIADITRVVQNCDTALAQAEQQAGVSARSAVIGIAGELVKGITSTVRVTRKDAEKVLDLAEVERIIKLVQQRAQEKAKRQMVWELGNKDVDVRLVNSALVGIEIDGYKVTNPVGFQGRDVVVQLYTAFAPLIHIGALERTAQQLDLDLVAVAAEPFAVSRSVIGDDTSASMSAILMDIGGGTTDIAVLNEGGVQGTKMFGIGGRAFTRSIERELGVEFEDAEDLKLRVSDGSLPHDKAASTLGALQKTLSVWSSGVELALSEFDKLDHLPHRVLLCGGGSSLQPLMDKLEHTDWYRGLPFTRKPIVQHIHPDQVVGIVDKTGQVNDHTFITAMGLLRVGLDTAQFSGTGPDGSIKERLDRILRV
ncbi:MAG TPA: cell division FtsA domain-containing protein [Candidatus Saccharimonadales bacterium]|nr:cell division FtsA domain-containing protein [Candidatus Saccharimonadales bacterium]